MSGMRIPFYDFAAEYREIQTEIDTAVSRVLSSGSYQHGREIAAFEEEFAAYCGVKHVVTTGSCYDAMFRGLLSLGVGPGNEVITAANADIACTAAISHAGASIVWADIDPDTHNIDPEKIEQKITPQTKALLIIHMYGHPADMNSLLDLARCHDLFVIEDAAIAVGARYKGKRVGTFGDIGCFSHAPSKILNNYGDGGSLVTNSDEIAERVRQLFIYSESQGSRIKVDSQSIHGGFRFTAEGYHGRMVELSAAILRVKLRKIDGWIESRREIANRYNVLLEELDIIIPREASDVYHVYRNYAIQVDCRDTVRRYLAEQGVETGMHYVPPLHLQEVYTHLGYTRGSLPVTESISERLFTLPMYPQLTLKQIEWVAATIGRACKALGNKN